MKFMNVIKKFESQKDMVKYRNDMLDEAQTLLDEGKMEEYKEKIEDVKTFDAEYKDYTEAQANVEALKGAVSMSNVLTSTAKEGIVDAISIDQEDKGYRNAFMNFVLRGTAIPAEYRNADAFTTTSDVTAVIPNTILDRIIEKMETTGTILNKVTKTFYKGGVTVPTSTAKPKATWTTERGTVDSQKKTTGSVTFAYHKLKVVVAISVAVDTVTLEVFERTVSNNITEAMVKAIEEAIVKGDGTNKPTGVLTAEVPTGQTIDIKKGDHVTYADLCKTEGALPSAYEKAEWYMSKKTYFGEVVGMVDSNGQPIARTSVGIDGKPAYNILGRPVNFTEHISDFATTVTEDTVVAFMYNFEDYILNTNLDITVKQYEDNDTDDKLTKAIMLADGKPVDLNSLVVMIVKNS